MASQTAGDAGHSDLLLGDVRRDNAGRRVFDPRSLGLLDIVQPTAPEWSPSGTSSTTTSR